MSKLLQSLQSQTSAGSHQNYLDHREVTLQGLRLLFEEELLVNPYLQAKVNRRGKESVFASMTAGAY